MHTYILNNNTYLSLGEQSVNVNCQTTIDNVQIVLTKEANEGQKEVQCTSLHLRISSTSLKRKQRLDGMLLKQHEI